MPEIVFYDVNGQETGRRPLTPGRPHLGSVKQPNGDVHVHAVKKFSPEYLVIDQTGTILSREPKGKGKGRPDFVKMKKGEEYQGHWVKRIASAKAVPLTT